ncbi:hypothetical protein [Flavobacterium cerinum]|uniref:Phage protein n=1 Tax=Flavobacterium cerinum TaxID=2502784 RepID=A0ABY5IY70_9FLAO|nr:hypothetical protein [Flavobacterium cerinum]UUC47092.1 hypothetical protein NOX80_07800 [Flavobacterium cerinum]
MKFKIALETIRKANDNLIKSGITVKGTEKFRGVITARINLDGIILIREISHDKINEAYGKALKKYAAKL